MKEYIIGLNVMSCSTKEDINIIQSPYNDPNFEVPEISLTDFLFKGLDMNYEKLKDEVWVVDAIKGTSYKFSDIRPLTEKFASALTQMGFKKGEILYFVTYDVALIYIIQIAVWRCGGGVRGCFQRESKEEYERQMREVSARFILCDAETAPSVKWAAKQLEWPVHLLSIGEKVEAATPVEEMIENDDLSALPGDVIINPKEDVIAIPNTSGSTGFPKGAMHTHYNLVALTSAIGAPIKIGRSRKFGKSFLTLMGNFAVGALLKVCCSILFGYSYYSVSKFDKKTFLNYLLKYKPENLSIYPYVANWLAREPEVDIHDLSFLKIISIGGSVVELPTVHLLSRRLPNVEIEHVYGMSECLLISSTGIYQPYKIVDKNSGKLAGLKIAKHENETLVSCGHLAPLVTAKVVDSTTGFTLGPGKKGILKVNIPYIMKGYTNSKKTEAYTTDIDEDGWLSTGDIAFFDEDGYLYVLERNSSIFKYYMHQVSPTEIETVIGEHPAVLSVGVVGVPDPLATSVARAYVVLKPNHLATEEEIKQFVAERKIFYKHLHGGVKFVDSLPESRGGKLDRPALLRMAIQVSQSCN